MEQSYLRCPSCGQMDMVQKVSAIVEGGITHGTAYSTGAAMSRGGLIVGSSQTRSTHQTEISKKLAFPEHRYGCFTRLAITLLLLAPLSRFFMVFVIAGYVAVNKLPISENNRLNDMMGMIFWGMIVLAMLLIGYVIVKKIFESSNRKRALLIWQHLFYCQRDDTVFAPDDPNLKTSSTNLKNLLNY